MLGDVIERGRDRVSQRQPDAVVAGLGGIIRLGMPTEREYLKACQPGLRFPEILTLGASDVGDRMHATE